MAILKQNSDGRVDLDAFAAFGNQKRAHNAFVDGFKLHRGLIGFNLCNHIAGLNLIAFFDQPFRQRAFLHRRRQRGH